MLASYQNIAHHSINNTSNLASAILMANSVVFPIWLGIVVGLGLLGSQVSSQPGGPCVPALYIFGDSTADVGTNNYLPESTARADFPFNGIDFPQSKPTGRFSNGYNTIDFLAQQLGFQQSPPPYLSFMESNLSQFLIKNAPTKGTNFASGGSGIQHHTGQKKWGKVVSLGEQVQQFSGARAKMVELMGPNALPTISKSLFIISVGSNDIFEHFDAKRTRRTYIPDLISTYDTHLRSLYKLGARKFGIISVGAVGCCPINRKTNKGGDCKTAMNDDAQLFYVALRSLLQKLSLDCKGLMYALADSYKMAQLVLDPRKPVFKEMARACCGKGTLNADEPCKRDLGAEVCGDRTAYLFWDQFHPTQMASNLAAYMIVNGSQPYVEPMSFGNLARLP